jgi:hypothetical protein
VDEAVTQGLQRALTYAPVYAEEFLSDRREQWDRLDEEAVEDFELFRIYRELGCGIRSIRATAIACDLSHRTVQRVATRNSWLARVGAYDAECHHQAVVTLEGSQLAMRQRHASLAQKMLAKGEAAMDLLDPRFMHPRDLGVIVDVAAKLERLSRGVTDTKRVEITGKDGGPIQVAQELSSQDRRALLEAAAAELNKRIKQTEIDNVIEGEIVEDEDDE